MAALKDSGGAPPPPPNGTARGRDGYSLYGVLRTKPGRADSPPTLCMSCSDKVASWNVLGIQGALASRLVSPVYIDSVVIGEVDAAMCEPVREDCERAMWGRLSSLQGSFRHSRCGEGISELCFQSIGFLNAMDCVAHRLRLRLSRLYTLDRCWASCRPAMTVCIYHPLESFP